METLQLGVDYYYHQPDGGQFNVRVHAIYSMYEGDKLVVMIAGKGLLAPCEINGVGLMVTEADNLSDKPIAEVHRLHRG